LLLQHFYFLSFFSSSLLCFLSERCYFMTCFICKIDNFIPFIIYHFSTSWWTTLFSKKKTFFNGFVFFVRFWVMGALVLVSFMGNNNYVVLRVHWCWELLSEYRTHKVELSLSSCNIISFLHISSTLQQQSFETN
jgi:hypothetical protein